MSKEYITFPEKIEFSTEIPIRKIDLSMDLHVSFASILDLVFEAHLQFFEFLGYSVTNIHGKSIIFANLNIDYLGELFFKDLVKIDVALANMHEKYFDLYFRVQKNQNIPVAIVKIRVLFFDYSVRKVVAIPIEFKNKFPFACFQPNLETTKSLDYPTKTKTNWKQMQIRQSVQALVKEIYEYTENLPPHEEKNLFLKLRKLAVFILTQLTQSYSNKIYVERMKSLLRLEASLLELEELLELSESLGYLHTKIDFHNLKETKQLLGEFRNSCLSVKKVILSDT